MRAHRPARCTPPASTAHPPPRRCGAEAERRRRAKAADDLFSANVKARKAAQLPDPDGDTPPKRAPAVRVLYACGWRVRFCSSGGGRAARDINCALGGKANGAAARRQGLQAPCVG